MSGPRLSSRIALLALGAIASWLAVLTVGLNLFVQHMIDRDVDGTVRAAERAEQLTLWGSITVDVLLLIALYPVLRMSASRALRPVQEMANHAAEWSIADPNRRLGPLQRFTELSLLAHSLDALLDRLSAILRHERMTSAEISHELRTPLARILAETELLLQERTDPRLEALRDSALGMGQIIETLLAGSRVDSNSVAGRASVSAIVRGLGVTAEIEPELYVALDQAVGTRMLAPVLANASRYAFVRVDVCARSEGNRVLIDIANDGPRLPPGDNDSIFLPGYRGEGDDHDGAGLGLALARRLARAAEGDLVLACHDPVTFRFVLPAGG